MADPYIGEIRMFGGNFAPLNWMLCQGQLLPISEYTTLYNLIGTTYGGDGVTTFGLPNLACRIPVHQGTGGGGTYVLGQLAGVENVSLSVNQIPSHTHAQTCSSLAATVGTPVGMVAALATTNLFSKQNPPTVGMAPQALTTAGGSVPHPNLQPFVVVNFIIALFGIYPPQG